MSSDASPPDQSRISVDAAGIAQTESLKGSAFSDGEFSVTEKSESNCNSNRLIEWKVDPSRRHNEITRDRVVSSLPTGI